MEEDNFISQKNNAILLKVVVKPNSKQQSLQLDITKDFLIVSLKSTPTKGKANKELVKYLSSTFSVSSYQIEIISGHTSRDKTILITGEDFIEIRERIKKFLK